MLSDSAKNRLVNLRDFLNVNKHKLIIDGDTHPSEIGNLKGDILKKFQSTPNYYQGRPISYLDLLESMSFNGIDMALIWQNPATFYYQAEEEFNFKKLLEMNREIAGFADNYPTQFIPAGWTDPKSLGVERAIEICEICVKKFGFPIIKMNPAQNAFPIDSDSVLKVVEGIIELGATPAFHFGGDSPYTPAVGLENIIVNFPKHPIIGVHMGGGGSHYVAGDPVYLEARKLGLKYKNLFYIMSSKRDSHMESDLLLYTKKGKPFCENLGWGSDAPYGLQSWNLGGIKQLLLGLSNNKVTSSSLNDRHPSIFTKEIIQNYLGTNLANLVLASCQNVLTVHKKLKSRIGREN